MSTFDKLYRSAIPMKFFTRGWGKPDTLLRLIENINLISHREKFLKILNEKPPVIIEKHTVQKNVVLIEGSFKSPFSAKLPGIMEPENETARFQVVLPKEWRSNYKPICIHFAGTGDHTYSRRRFFLANGLLADGIGSIIVMNPYYWKRKPKDQRGSSLNHVSDLFVMGGALILECGTILNWCELNGYGPLALHGISMGGYMASLCATVWPKPISLVPCLSWTTASVVFVDGVLGTSVDWAALTKQYFSDAVYANKIRPLIHPTVPERFRWNQPDSLSTHQSCERIPVTSVSDPSSRTEKSSDPPVIHKSQSVPPHASSKLGVMDGTGGSNSEVLSSGLSQTATVLNSFPRSPLLIPLKELQALSLRLPTVIRRASDVAFWHNGLSRLRSLPDNLGLSSNPPDPEVCEFLRELLDYFTHLGNFSPVVDPRLVLAVAAEQDAYVPRTGVIPLNELYPGSDVRLLAQSGHVGAYLRNAVWTRDFRQAITDCLNRQVELHYGEPGPFGLPPSKPSSPPPATRRKH